MRRTSRLYSSGDLEKSLERALKKRNLAELTFRARHVKKWTAMYCDTSRFLSTLSSLNEEEINSLIDEYHLLVVNIIRQYDPPFLDEIRGPQVLACFSSPSHAADAAIAIQKTLQERKQQDERFACLIPSIGLHTGDFVVRDGSLQQSNASNLGKRIETEADRGMICLSSETFAALQESGMYKLRYVSTARVKNIPEPQRIYKLDWDSAPESHRMAPGITPVNHPANTADVVSAYMGILICDIAGSTRKFWNMGDLEGNLLIEMYRREVFPILMKYKAVNIEICDGDQIVACFNEENIPRAVLAAVEIQKSLFRRNVNMATRERYKLQTAIGIHTGPVEIMDKKVLHNSTYFTCKSIQCAAEENEIYLSDEVKEYLKKYDNLTLHPAGEMDMQGGAKTICLYSLEWYRTGR